MALSKNITTNKHAWKYKPGQFQEPGFQLAKFLSHLKYKFLNFKWS